ncbi:hypothetical protein RGQ29_012178 [Quercus rubra]|uniref:F-box domain-containing protein n=1 Tax=Quercus rubra TaxID=3512 RepID=A0AAN7G9G2_QUERU|nr:hypothetical protein RGQ29_012178 [Quercus rubra]
MDLIPCIKELWATLLPWRLPHSKRHSKRSNLLDQGIKTTTLSLDDLHDSVLMEILIRLPLRSVFQCKSVSSHWFYLISTSYFANHFNSHCSSMHPHPPFTLLIQRNCDLFLTLNKPEFKSFKSPNFIATPNPVHNSNNKSVVIVEASCNDLLLCSSSEFKPPFQLIFYVVNPITKQWVVLPPVPLFGIDYRVGFICRYDNNDTLNYRVVYIPPYDAESKEMEIKVETFISEMGEWIESMVSCPGDFGRRGVPYKNLLFWWDNSCGRLIWFDPYSRECYRFFEHPIKLDPYHSIECHGGYADCLRQCQISKNPLGACHGCLRICQILKNPQMILRLWELEDYDDNGGGKWCLEHEMHFNEMALEKYPQLREYINSDYCPMFVAYHPNDRDVVYLIINFLKFWVHGNNVQQLMVISCDMRRKTLEVIYDNPLMPRIRNRFISYRNLFDVFTFVHLWWPTPISSLS